MARMAKITEEDLDFMLTCFDDLYRDLDEVLQGDQPVFYFNKDWSLCIYQEGDKLPPLEA